MKITAAVIRDPQAPYSIEQLELREPGQGEVLVRIVGVGMCHTDVLPRIPGIGMPLPIVCGHEGAGIVQAVGPGVTAVAVGDHVVMSFDSCGACTNCRTGHPAYCETFMLRNLSGLRADLTTPMSADGGEMIAGSWFGQSSFASHSLATERNVVKVDDDLPLEQLGPLGCGLQTGAGSVLVAMKARPGTSIAVFGTGAVGIAAVMAARVAGCTTIIGVDLNDHRLEVARELGATHTFNGADPEVGAQILALTGDGVQYAFDTTGVPGVILTALGCAAPDRHLWSRRRADRAVGDRPELPRCGQERDGHPRGRRRAAGVHPRTDRPVAPGSVPVRSADRHVRLRGHRSCGAVVAVGRGHQARPARAGVTDRGGRT